MAQHTATISWKRTGPDFLKGKYSREHLWSFDGGATVPASPSPHNVPLPWCNPASVDPEEANRLQDEWDALDLPVPLKILDSPYREITRPVLSYVKNLRRKSPRDVVTVFIPEYVVGHWWEHLLHNQSALRLKARLLFQPQVMVIS